MKKDKKKGWVEGNPLKQNTARKVFENAPERKRNSGNRKVSGGNVWKEGWKRILHGSPISIR